MVAQEIKETDPNSKEMTASEYTGCSLYAISGVYGCGDTAYASEQAKKQFEAFAAKKQISGNYHGAYVQAGILTISVWPNSPPVKTMKFLAEHGFKLLGIYPGAHGDYKNYLYGSSSFELPKQKDK